MEVNEIVKLEDGTEVIAVLQVEETCLGCFFNKGFCKAIFQESIECWDKEGNELIFKRHIKK